jgi:hypothetical protein
MSERLIKVDTNYKLIKADGIIVGGGGGVGGGAWGDITGTLSDQTDLQSALDLKAPLVSPTFTGNLVLPNNSRINNIEHFYQADKPITRGDGSALVIGDRWWKTDEGTEWFWNGTYWLSTVQYILTINFNQTQFSSNLYSAIPTVKIFITQIFLNVSNTNALAQAGWFWESQIVLRGSHDAAISPAGILPVVRVTFDGVTTAGKNSITINSYFDLLNSTYNFILCNLSKGGNLNTYTIAGATGFLYHIVA